MPWLNRTCVAMLSYLALGAVHGQELVKSTKDTRYVQSIQISPNNNHLLAISSPKEDGTYAPDAGVHLFDRKKQTKHLLVKSIDSDIRGVTFSPDGKDILAGGSCFFGAWTSPKKKNWFLYKGCPEGPGDVFMIDAFAAPTKTAKIAFSVTRRKDFDSSNGGRPLKECKLVLWDLGSQKTDLQVITSDQLPVQIWFEIAFSASGNFLAHWNNRTKDVIVHDTQNLPYKDVAVWKSKLDVSQLRFAPDEKSVWALSRNRLHQYDVVQKKEIRSIALDGDVAWFHVLTDGSRFLVAEKSGILFIDPKKKNPDTRVNLGKTLHTVTISPDEMLLAGGAIEGGIYIWNLNELRKNAK